MLANAAEKCRGDFKPKKSAGGGGAGAGIKHQHGSIVQFRYGEDGVDPTKESYLYKFDFLVQTCMPLAQRLKRARMGAPSELGRCFCVRCTAALVAVRAQRRSAVEQGGLGRTWNVVSLFYCFSLSVLSLFACFSTL